ncbi:transporter substrate-binding domain-containing protein [Lentisalinibacter sediminis]|uniref:transporter substrate-binding domain-containing protein n=1 Tax=Lentisalinibacter sediminis TaxID=2992237 RepID=UPI003869CE13
MISKLRITALLVAVLALLLSAGPAAARSLDEIREAGVLRVGTSLFTPWAIRAGEGQLIGFEADIARKLAADMGVEPELKVYPWKDLVDALEADEIDIIAAGMSVTPARALRVWFSDAYHESGITLATNTAKTADVARLEDLNDPRYRIGVVKGTVAEDLARRVFGEAKIKVYDQDDKASGALLAGRIDGYLESYPGPQFLALENPERIDTPLAKPLLTTRSAFAVARGNADLVYFLNAWITARQADTWLPSTESYWFRSLRWRERLED